MNTLKINMIVTTIIGMLAFTPGCMATGFSNATFRVRVVDEEGVPIGGVRSKLMNIYDMGSIPGGVTDTNGIYSCHLTKVYEVSGYFEKHGYYKSGGVFWNWDNQNRVPPAGTIFPIVMKRIIEPVSMTVKEFNAILPRMGESVGFDLEICDWVFPDGKGKIADMFFTIEGYYAANKNFSIQASVEFLGDKNGIQSFHYPKETAGHPLKSELPPPAIAPESGYESLIERFSHHIPPEKWASSSYDETCRWIYRIRTKVDDDGNIVAANYGWFVMDISVGPFGETGRVFLKYYYNPDPQSRSLEPKEIADRQARDLPKEP